MKDHIIYLDDSIEIYKVSISVDYVSFYSNVVLDTNNILNYCIHLNSTNMFFKTKEKLYKDEHNRYHLYRNFESVTIFKTEDEPLYEAEMRCMKIVKLMK